MGRGLRGAVAVLVLMSLLCMAPAKSRRRGGKGKGGGEGANEEEEPAASAASLVFNGHKSRRGGGGAVFGQFGSTVVDPPPLRNRVAQKGLRGVGGLVQPAAADKKRKEAGGKGRGKGGGKVDRERQKLIDPGYEDEISAIFGTKAAELRIPDMCRRTVRGKEGKPSTREIAFMASGIRREITSPDAAGMAAMVDQANQIPPCTLITKNCMSGDGKFGSTKWAMKGMSKGSKKNIPELNTGVWGSCAIVGSSESLLKYSWGKDIDAHDTIIRYNAPVKRFAKHVGSRSDVILWKEDYKKEGVDANEKHNPKWFIMNTMQARRDAPDLFNGGVPVVLHRLGNEAQLGKVLTAYARGCKHDGVGGPRSRIGGARDQLVPTTGFRRVIALVNSDLCTRVDLYGFSSGGGKYFNKEVEPHFVHVLPGEHLTYRLLMEQGKLCVYGD